MASTQGSASKSSYASSSESEPQCRGLAPRSNEAPVSHTELLELSEPSPPRPFHQSRCLHDSVEAQPVSPAGKRHRVPRGLASRQKGTWDSADRGRRRTCRKQRPRARCCRRCCPTQASNRMDLMQANADEHTLRLATRKADALNQRLSGNERPVAPLLAACALTVCQHSRLPWISSCSEKTRRSRRMYAMLLPGPCSGSALRA